MKLNIILTVRTLFYKCDETEYQNKYKTHAKGGTQRKDLIIEETSFNKVWRRNYLNY